MAKNKKNVNIAFVLFSKRNNWRFHTITSNFFYSRIAVSVTTQTKDVGLVQSGHNHVAYPHHDIAAHLVLKH